MKITMILLVSSLLVLIDRPVFSYDSQMEGLLLTSPNIDASEYVLAIQNNLPVSLSYLDNSIEIINAMDEPEIYKTIRIMHINLLKGFVYYGHDDGIIRNREREKKQEEILQHTFDNYKQVIDQFPEYSDLYRISVNSIFLYMRPNLESFAYILRNKKYLFSLFENAILLNPNNPMAKVVYANYDMIAPGLSGARKERGLKNISPPVQSSWPKIQQFEYTMSKLIACFIRKDDEEEKKLTEFAYLLYPNTWRIEFLKSHYKK